MEGISSASGSTSASQDEAWQPRLVQVRGWIPWACSFDEKLRKEDAIEVDKRFLALCGPELTAFLFPLQHFALSDPICFKVRDGSDVRRRANEIQAPLDRKDFKVRGEQVRAGFCPSPKPMEAVGFFHGASSTANELGLPFVVGTLVVHAAFDCFVPRHDAQQLRTAVQVAAVLRELLGARVQPRVGNVAGQ